MEELCHMGDAVLADPQGIQLLFAGVRLNQAFNDALDIETLECGVAPRPVVDVPPVTTHDMSKSVDAWMAERHVQAFNDTLGMNSCTTSSWPRGDKDLGNPNWRGQTPERCISQDERELACRAAVEESGSQTLGVAVNSVILRPPLIKHPSYQRATASGCYTREVLTEVSAGTNMMVAHKVTYSMCCGM